MLSTFLAVIKSFSPKQFTLFLIASALVLLTGILLIIQIINTYTVAVATDGGTYTEGSVGQVAYLNPVLARDGSADKDAVTLLFASAYDLAESIQHDDSFRTWNLRIQEGALWHDQTPVTSDDIIFTLQIIQNADTASPLFSSWQNVSVSRISEREVQFETVNAYALFENLLKDFRPIPKKYFTDLSPANIRLSAYNLSPIGSGPFMFEKLEKRADGFITQISLTRNPRYEAIGHRPHLDHFITMYFENEDSLVKSFNKGVLDGFGTFTPSIEEYVQINAHVSYVPTSRYYALFFNENTNQLLASQALRRALWLFIDRSALTHDVFADHAVPQQGPLPVTSDVELTGTIPPKGNVGEATSLLEAQDWFFDEETRTWNKVTDKGVQQLAFTIKIPDTPILRKLADLIQKQWGEQGINSSIEVIDTQAFGEDILRTRNYEMIIYGNILLPTPDLTSFWYSNERFYPGLNFSLFESDTVDTLLQQLRSIEPSSPSRNEALQAIANEIISQSPAAFLVSPQYLYLTRTQSVGAPMERISTPESRFAHITDWYARTKRVAR